MTVEPKSRETGHRGQGWMGRAGVGEMSPVLVLGPTNLQSLRHEKQALWQEHRPNAGPAWF